jgi:aminopeptidase-like protein
LVVALVGDPGPLTYKRSRHGRADIDRAVEHVLETLGEPFEVLDFSPYGYDERQFGSPGIDRPVGRLTRSPNGAYPEYHTSADNLDLVNRDSLKMIDVLERNRRYRNTAPKCEPQLGKRGLYRNTGGQKDVGNRELALLRVLNQSDGDHALLDVTERSRMPFSVIADAADELH